MQMHVKCIRTFFQLIFWNAFWFGYLLFKKKIVWNFLQSEKERWGKEMISYEKQQKSLCLDVLLTSAFVSYLGYFNSQFRGELFNNAWIPFLQSQKVT